MPNAICKYIHINKNFEAFMAEIFQVQVFWVVTPCSVTLE